MPGFQVLVPHECPDSPGVTGEGPSAYPSGYPDDYVSPSYNIETARKHRFLLELMSARDSEVFGVGVDGITLFAYKATRPSPEFDEIVIHSGQDEIYRPGKNRWKPLDITFYEVLKEKEYSDITDKDLTASMIYGWWANTMLNISSSTHNPVKKYMANGLLTMLDGYGRVIWEYNLLGCWPQKVTPSDVDFSDTGIAEITLTLRFQKAWERRNRANL